MPMKPVKWGIKIWERSYSFTVYIYIINAYDGKKQEQVDKTLGERVVHKLSSSTK